VGTVLAIAVPEDRCTHGSEYLVHFVHFVHLLDQVVVLNLFNKVDPCIYAIGIVHIRGQT